MHKPHTKMKSLLLNLTILFFAFNSFNLQGQNNLYQNDDYTLNLDKALNNSGALFTLVFSNNTNQIETFKNAEVSV